MAYYGRRRRGDLAGLVPDGPLDGPRPAAASCASSSLLLLMKPAARSAIMVVGSASCPFVILGITDASATRRLATPFTRSCASTTCTHEQMPDEYVVGIQQGNAGGHSL